MKRKIIGAAAAYMSGLFFASFFYDKLGAVMVICAAVLMMIYGRLKGFKAADYCLILISFVTAVTANRLYTDKYYDKLISFSGSICSFSGCITDYDIYEGDLASYVLDGRINGTQRAKITLATYELDADYGDILTIENCFFDEIKSDYLFDSKTWNKSRHIFLRAVPKSDISVKHTNSGKMRSFLADFRRTMIFKLRTEMGEDAGGFLSGMIFGEKRYLDDSLKTALYRSGIGHIMAVSGLHVSIIAAIIMKLLRRAGVNKYARFAAINCLFLLLIALTNYPISAIRAAIMLDIMYSAELFGQQNDSFNSLSVAALMICLFDPYAVYSSGFILSISGIFGIAVFAPYMTQNINREKLTGRILAAFVTAICTSLAVMPASMYYFDETSLIAPIANIMLVPLCTAAMILGLIFIVTGCCLTVLLYPAGFMIAVVLKITDIASSVSDFHLPRTSRLLPLLFIISAVSVATVYLFIGRRSAVTVTLSIIIALNSISAVTMRSIRRDRLIIAVLGNGSSAAAVISKSGRTMIVDFSGHYKAPEYVRKYLNENGFDSVSMLILTDSVQSQYAAYMNEISSFSPKNVCISGESRLYGGTAQVVDSDSVCVEESEYKLEYSDDCLTVSYGNSDITVAPADKSADVSAELAVYYGSGSASSNTTENECIYLKDMNNFEIILTDDGEYSIRRL